MTCEMCGSTDLIKENGVFVCQNCGTKYSVEEAKKMMVEGTVEISGFVKTDNSEAYIKRAEPFLSEEKWDQAAEYYNKALDENPDSWQAYFGLFLSKNKYKDVDDLKKTGHPDYQSDPDYLKAVERCPEDRKQLFVDIGKTIIKRNEEESSSEHITKIKHLHERAKALTQNIILTKDTILALKPDGTVLATGNNSYGQCNVDDWKDIIQICADPNGAHTVGLKSDGTVLVVGSNAYDQCNVSSWTEIVKVIAHNGITVGMKTDGSLMCATEHPDWVWEKSRIMRWTNVKDIWFGDRGVLFGLLNDGTAIQSHPEDRSKDYEIIEHQDAVIDLSGKRFETVGLTDRGEVFFYSKKDYYNYYSRFYRKKVSSWKDLMAIYTPKYDGCVYGLTNKGTCLAINNNDFDYGQCDIGKWNNVIQMTIAERYYSKFTYGLTENGNIFVSGGRINKEDIDEDDDYKVEDFMPWNVEDLQDIVSIQSNPVILLAVKKNGRIELRIDENQLDYDVDVSNWRLFDDPDEYLKQIETNKAESISSIIEKIQKRQTEEQEELKNRRKEEQKSFIEKVEKLKEEEKKLLTELENLKGLFSGKRKKEIESSLQDIRNEMKELLNRIHE
ncbi:MAG: hypothetical protein IJI66_16600 [Erysipelotrichaceae bacterium]|nr:hypothetical protein [Erysipelotrichaceae bacterium]